MFQSKETKDNRYAILMNDLAKVTLDLQAAYRNLGNALDPDLIDCYIYELNSVQMRYKFLLTSIRKIKEEDPYTRNPLETLRS